MQTGITSKLRDIDMDGDSFIEYEEFVFMMNYIEYARTDEEGDSHLTVW